MATTGTITQKCWTFNTVNHRPDERYSIDHFVTRKRTRAKQSSCVGGQEDRFARVSLRHRYKPVLTDRH